MEPIGRRSLPVPPSLPSSPVSRFAPAPTGYLHIGHLVSAVYVWGVARRLGGTVLLRIEDHDRGRSRPEYEVALLDDLEWLGLVPDEPAVEHLRAGPSSYRQSDRGGRYQEVLATLAEGDGIYRCRCSRKDIAGDAPPIPGREVPYPGTCRDRSVSDDVEAGIRLVMDSGEETFTDVLLGPQAQNPADQCGDLLLRDRTGNWTYQFAVTVDDWDQGVDLVIRGQDLLSSTGRQIRLARLLGRDRPPTFLHHPLVRHASGEKLSKANRDTGLRELRAAGVHPGTVLGEAAFRGGLLERPASLAVVDLPELFPGLDA